MQKNQNIQIPISLFNKIVTLAEYLYFSGSYLPQILKFDEILSGLREKQHNINKRAIYSDIIYSSGDKKMEAIKNFQKLKNLK